MKKQTIQHKYSLEIRLFQIGCWVVITLSTGLLLIDFFLLKDYPATRLESISIVLFTVFLIFAYGKNPLKYIYPFLVILLIITDAAFLLEKGWATATIVIYFIGIIYGSILVSSRHRKLLIFILMTNFLGLTVIEIMLFPVPKYVDFNPLEYQQIHLIFAGIGTIVVSFLIRYFKVNYDLEQKLIREKNIQLSDTHLRLQKRNNDLRRIQKAIVKKQKKLNEKSTRLIEKNAQIESLNLSLEGLVKERSKELSSIINELNLLFYRSSHDFRRPLTTMLGLSNIAKFSDIDGLTKNILALVGETAEAMKKTLDKYLVLYQINDLDVFPVFSWDDLRENISRFVMAHDIDFACSIETKNYLTNDRRNFLLNIIIYQLIENCCLYRKKNKNDQVRVNLYEDNGYLNLSVWDNGQGIPEDVVDNIFTIYFRGNSISKGCGLGLHVVKTAVDKLGAKIKVKSIENEFTQFDIQIKI